MLPFISFDSNLQNIGLHTRGIQIYNMHSLHKMLQKVDTI